MSLASISVSQPPMPTTSEIDMRNSGVILRKVGVMSPQVFGERVASYLREAHPHKTALAVEAETGISAKTVAKWIEGASAPSGSAYHRLIKVYGAELIVFVSPDASPESLRDAARQCQQARLERAAATIRGQLAEVMGAR